MANSVDLEERMIITFGMRISWSHLRPYVYTLATTMSFHNMWRLPRASYEWGGLSYAVGVSVVLVGIGLPTALLQLAMGQLSQQDPVGVWKAVPFFKGVGYLRLLISFICSVYSIVYLALTVAFFLYTLGRSIPFQECYLYDRVSYHSTNATMCLDKTFLAPVTSQPEYYIALTLIIIVTWSKIPFMLYSPVKFIKRLFFVLSPIALMLAVVVQIGVADRASLSLFRWGDTRNFIKSHFWHSTVAQAFLSTNSAGGFLIAASDPIYANIDLKRTAMFFIISNLAVVWLSLLFWHAVGSAGGGPVAVLTQVYDSAVDRSLHVAWPLTMFAMLIFMGIITVLCLLFPIYEHCRRGGGLRWRQACVGVSLAGAAAAQVALYFGLPALHLLEDLVAPFLITITTTAEILIFFFVYGRKYIVEDIEFLTGRRFHPWWSYSFCVVPSVVLPLWLWWVVAASLAPDPLLSQNHLRLALTMCFLLVLGVIVVFALVAVAKQDQYDKKRLKSSLQPSKDWGPSDPVSHHYWLESKKEVEPGPSEPSHTSHDVDLASDGLHIYDDVVESEVESSEGSSPPEQAVAHDARYDSVYVEKVGQGRCNSYDWVYTVNRRRGGDDKLSQFARKRVRRTHSCELSSRRRAAAVGGAGVAGGSGGLEGSYRRCSTIARLSDSLQKLHSIPPARAAPRRKSVY